MSDFPFPHSETDCAARAAGICGRLHVGDSVTVTYDRGQVGFGLTGTVTAQVDASFFTVHFPEGAPVVHAGVLLDTVNDLTYSEGELELTS